MDGDQFIVYSSLQKMAAHTVALRIWHGYISRSAHYENQHPRCRDALDDLGNTFELGANFQLECNELIKSLQIPESIKNILIKSLKNIQTEMDIWIYSLKDFVFDEEMARYKYRVRRTDQNCCVWTPNFKIDYLKTASKMISIAELNKIQKFIMMCKFCLENEIWDYPFYSLHSKTLRLLHREPVLEYWICKLRGERSSMRIENMIYFYMTYNLYAVQYFWEQLSVENQVMAAPGIFKSIRGHCHLKLLTKMSDLHQKQLICRLPATIMKNFICWLEMPENALLCWTKTKDIMSNEVFSRCIGDLFRVSEEENKTGYTEDCHALLVHIWDTAPDHLKNNVLEKSFDDIVQRFFSEYHNHSGAGLTFFLRLLSSKTPEYRKSFMLENAVKFATHVPVLESHLTANLIKFCFPNIDDKVEFGKLIMSSDGGFKESYQKILLE